MFPIRYTYIYKIDIIYFPLCLGLCVCVCVCVCACVCMYVYLLPSVTRSQEPTHEKTTYIYIQVVEEIQGLRGGQESCR